MSRTRGDGRAPLREHLRELRRRAVLAAAGTLAAAVAGWWLYAPVFDAVQAPVLAAGERRGSDTALNFSGLASAFDLHLKGALFLGVLLACPWWLYQLWAFVTPGLTGRERRWAVGFLGAAVPLFAGGVALAWWALPNAVRMLTAFTPDGAANFIDAQSYLSFVMRLALAFGIAFVLPVLMAGLGLAGVVRGSTWLGGWRWAVIANFVFAAVMTPTPDAVTMLAVAVPMCALYFAAVAVCLAHDRRLDARRAALLGASGDRSIGS
ncbi:twin-arginine translocase subunit TatC [Luteimicrobium sp. DT211]|uniref:twin-arginine translocase subunit TatC n=1 Tax=Luteimicrobium sp. DT211 TaxID=3393412 RepID=UPI003CF6EB71